MKWFPFFKKKPTVFTYDYVPPKPFSGRVTIKSLDFRERMALLALITTPDGKVNYEGFANMPDRLNENILKFDVRCGKQRFTNLEDLIAFYDGYKVLNELVELFIRGIPLKDKPPAPVIKLVKA